MTRLSCADFAMTEANLSNNDHKEFRRLAAEDPRRARLWLNGVLDRGGACLDELLRRVSEPGEGRLRQVIANTVRTRVGREAVLPHIAAWAAVETDEFARRAELAVLESATPTEVRGGARPPLVEPKLAVAYRYATDRLKHQLRNGLLDPMASVMRLRGEIAAIGDDVLRTALEARIGALSDALARFGRAIEFDPSDEHFLVRTVVLCDWLRAFNDEYARRFRPVRLQIPEPADRARIQANNHLLSTIFWNLWVNAQQAVTGDCEVSVRFARLGRRVRVTILDNGPGFASDIVDVVLDDGRRRSVEHRGRGLLEVQDAVDRLHGQTTLDLVEGSHRISLSLPLGEDA